MPCSSSSLSVPRTLSGAAACPNSCATAAASASRAWECACALTWTRTRRGLDVALLVEDPQVELEVGPVGRKRGDDRFEVLGERHGWNPSQSDGRWQMATSPGHRALEQLRCPAICHRLLPLKDHERRRRPPNTSCCALSGLVDRSARGKLLLTGSEAAEFLQGQVTNDVEALAPGTGCYALLLTHKGKVRADMRVLRGEDWILLDTEPHGLAAARTTVRDVQDRTRRAARGRDAPSARSSR